MVDPTQSRWLATDSLPHDSLCRHRAAPLAALSAFRFIFRECFRVL
jgi:hypothetical protein